MSLIELKTLIENTPEVCFDLSLSIDLHKVAAENTSEEAIDGTTSGLIQLNEFVTWKAKHFGFWFKMTTKITSYNKPQSFTDEMTDGPFKLLKHHHRFEQDGENKTLMIDEFHFKSPFGFIGALVDSIVMKSHLRRFLIKRNKVIKEYAENGKWKELVLED